MQDPTFERLNTDRLVIRRFRALEAEVFASYRNDVEVSRYQDWKWPYSVLDAEKFITALQDRAPGAPGGWFQFAVTLPDSERLIGDVALGIGEGETRHAELGFTFSAGAQGQGYATEAVGAIVDYAFATLAMHRILARTDARDLPARRVLERLGFRQEGESERIRFKEDWATDLFFARLASE